MTRRRLGQILLAIGFVCLIVGAWSGAQYRAATARRVFFVDPFSVAAGDDGRVYVGVDRREVHVYDEEGRPLSAWTVDVDAGRFRLRTNEEGGVEVAREHPGEWIVYDDRGRLVSREPDAEAFARFGDANDRRVAARDGTVYGIDEAGLYREVSGARTLIVPAPPAPLRWLGPRPIKRLTALLFAGTIGLLVGAVSTAAPTTPRDEP